LIEIINIYLNAYRKKYITCQFEDIMDTSCSNIVDFYDEFYGDLVNIRNYYVRRIVFYNNELYKLKLSYANNEIHDNVYFKKLCPLNMEKTNINKEYKDDIDQYIERFPSVSSFQKIVDKFVKDLV
jgi:hypothetical protein